MATEAETAVAEVTAVAEKPATEKEAATAAPVPEAEPEKKAAAEKAENPKAEEAEKPKVEEDEKKIGESASFKEESNVVGELPDPEKKALEELKALVQEALNKHEFTASLPPPPPPPAKEEEKPAEPVPVEEEKKTPGEEPKPEQKADAPTSGDPVPAEPEPVVAPAETKEIEEKAVETPAPPSAETSEPAVVVAEVEVVQKVTGAAEEDGARTVEAIKETIVAIATQEEPAPITEAPPPEPKKEAAETSAPPPPAPEEVSIWGIPLLADERSDVVLLKFLRARDFKVKEAFAMLKNTVRWRKDFGIDSLLDEDLGSADLDKVVFMHGVDKEGHPVCYNAFGEFQNKELYQNTFSDEEKRQKFLRWRILFLEKSIRKLDFTPDGVNTIVQVNDLKNSPGPFKRELRLTTNQALHLLQDNYPEFVAKQVFINVPWWYLTFYRMISPFFTQRTKSKFVFAGPSKSAETLFKYIAPEQVPVQYGGLSRDGEQDFTVADPVTEEIIKPARKHAVEFPVSEACSLVWEVRVVSWDVTYGAEFQPSAEGGYTVIIQKSRKISPADETVISGSFKIGEPGKLVLTFDNQTSKKKKLLYRSKTKPSD